MVDVSAKPFAFATCTGAGAVSAPSRGRPAPDAEFAHHLSESRLSADKFSYTGACAPVPPRSFWVRGDY